MNTAPSLAQFIEKQALSNKWREIWSIIGLLEKLVNGFPLFGGSTFEQEEDRAHPAGPRLHGLYPTGLQSSVAASPLASLLSLLVQGTKPCGPGSLPPPTEGRSGIQDQPQGLHLPSNGLEGMVVWWGAEPSTGLLLWVLVGEGSPRILHTPLSQGQLRPAKERKGGPPDHAQKELPLNCPGRKPVMLVWTGAVSTEFGILLKKRLQSRKCKEEKNLARAPGA